MSENHSGYPMSYISHSHITEFMGHTLWVNSKASGLYTNILKKMLAQIEAMLSYHNKVLLIRFDLNQPDYTDDSKAVTVLFKLLSESIKREYELKRVAYFWVREQEKAKRQHYHCFILVDGNKVQKSHKVIDKIRWYWTVQHDGGIHFPQPTCFHMLHRNKPETFQDPIYHISYLAKGRGKGYKPPQAKNYGASRLRPK